MRTIDASMLESLTINMLERTAMVLAEPAAPDEARPPATTFARITYDGPSKGTLVLGATEGFLRELAASLLGVEPGEVDVQNHGTDALREMANIVGGSVIMALSEGACEFSLGLPELLGASVGAMIDAQTDVDARCVVVGESGSLSVCWRNGSISKAA